MAAPQHPQFRRLPLLTVPLGGALGLGVALTSQHRGEDAWAVWALAASGLSAASGAAFAHGLRRWSGLAAVGPVPVRAAARPVVVAWVLGGGALVLLWAAGFAGTWRALTLVLVAAAGVTPGGLAMIGIGLLAAAPNDAAAPPGAQLSRLLALRRLLQSLLGVMGGIVALLVIAEATGQRMADRSAVEITLAFGATSSVAVAVVYLTPAARLRARARELVDACRPLAALPARELPAALEDRRSLESALGVDRTLFSDLQTNLVVVSPLIAGAASYLLAR
ncbi:hypothetical protein ACX6XY_27305 [Streptomyces sp. O3]